MARTTRKRAAARRADSSTSSSGSTLPTARVTSDAVDVVVPPTSQDDIYGVSDRELHRQRDAKAADSSVVSQRRSTRSRAAASNVSTVMSTLDNLTSTNDNSPLVVELGRRDATGMEESSLLGAPPRLGGGNLSGLEIHDDEIFGNLDSSFDMSAADAGGSSRGLRSADTSTASAFNVSVFRRQQQKQRPASRSRQRRRSSSIVGRDDAPIRPSSRGPTTPGLSSTFSLGNFKRRQRQPSILLSSAQKAGLELQRSRATSVASGDDNAVESEVEGEAEESFMPEAEGTPIRLSRRRQSAADEGAGAETQSRLEPEPQVDGVPEANGGRQTRSRKRKSDQGHKDETAKRQAIEAEGEPEAALHDSIEIDDRSSPPSFVGHRRRATYELDENIFAPPASSSSREGSPMNWPSIKDLGKKNKAPTRARKVTPAIADDMSDISEPPSLTHSPNFKATKPAKNKRQDSPKLSTADLEALLPRRRRRIRRGEDNMDDEDSNISEQELPARISRKKPTKALKESTKTNQNNAEKEAAGRVKRTARRTYGSRRFDKENTVEGESIEVGGDAAAPLDDTAFEADVNDDTTTTTLGLGAELKAASRKFKEVDRWELDFEEVVEPSSDLPEGR